MRILLIGNFAPPYEEENLYNISLLNKLEEDGHTCVVINISRNSSSDSRFIDAQNMVVFVAKLLSLSRGKDVIHFSTKGYLRVGLLKMMASIFIAKIFRVRSIITFHSELFSLLGQMRSPFGGTQTLYTTFFLADKILFADQDTYDVATMYKKRPNFELVPSFMYLPDRSRKTETPLAVKLKDKKKVIVFTNAGRRSFLFEILMEMLINFTLPEDTSIVIFPARKDSSGLRQEIENAWKGIKDDLFILEHDDLGSALVAFSKADIILRPLSCDGETFFDSFTISAGKPFRKGNLIYFPNSLVFVKEGHSAKLCARVIITMLSEDMDYPPDSFAQHPFDKIKKLYEK